MLAALCQTVPRRTPIQDGGLALLLIGSIVLIFSVLLSAAELVVSQASERNYDFVGVAGGGLAFSLLLFFIGSALYLWPRRKVPHIL